MAAILDKLGQGLAARATPLDWGACTDPGRVRQNNEDSFGFAPELGLFVLSDGMGGYASGEVASRIVTESVIRHCREAAADPGLPLSGEHSPGVSDVSNRLLSSIRLANDELCRAARENPDWQGMGATVVAVCFDQDRMSLAHVGDSRAYRSRRGALEQLTQDHSFVAEEVRQGRMTAEEAGRSALQNVLLRALGRNRAAEVELQEELVLEGDTLLLCSDGLTRELTESQILAVLTEAAGAQQAAERLVRLANEAGGQDNITAIVLHIPPRLMRAFARLGRSLRALGAFGERKTTCRSSF